MSNRETFLGKVQDVNGTNVSVTVSEESLTGFIYIDGKGYRIGQIGSFVRIPIGFSDLFGIISQVGASAIPEKLATSELPDSRWMTIQLIGEGERNRSFSRGLSQYPTIGDEVHLVSEKELSSIYGQPDKPYFVNLGHVANADSIPALVDINKLVNRHSAVVGTTGSGKSTTVASIMNALSDPEQYPSARIVMLDLHGEYSPAMKGRANIFRLNQATKKDSHIYNLCIPYWALSFNELCEISFGEFNNEKDRNIVMEYVLEAKKATLKSHPIEGVDTDILSVDSPVPFSLHKLWYDLCLKTFATYYSGRNGKQEENLAFETDDQGKELVGDAEKGIAPRFKPVATAAGVDAKDKINYIKDSLNISKQLQLLGTKLRIPRYNFIFKPDQWLPAEDGKPEKDLDELFKNWIGSGNPVSILDLSGIPLDILQTSIGAVLRILYDALFWSRHQSQGARERPLLLVLEEAHIYLTDDNKNIATNIVKRVVKEGRKYGIGAMIVSQRPSEINSTILSQCGTFFALRMNNSTDRGHITSAVSDNLDGLTNMLPILKTGEAIILGEAVKLPMRTYISPPPKNRRPDSQDPIIYDEVATDESQHAGGWGIKMQTSPDFEQLVLAWRNQNPIINHTRGNKMNYDMHQVTSSNVAAVGYDEASETLNVEFIGGSCYFYFDVPEHHFTGLLNADSVGKYLNEHIKGVYRYQKQ